MTLALELLSSMVLWTNPWGPPSTAEIIREGYEQPSLCEITATYTWADDDYAWCTNWYANCPDRPVQLGFCDPLHGTGERTVETNDGPTLTGQLEIWSWTDDEEQLYGSHPAGSYTVTDWEGYTWTVVFDATLTLGAGLECLTEGHVDLEPVWHEIDTGDPATGVQRGYLCCPGASVCY